VEDKELGVTRKVSKRKEEEDARKGLSMLPSRDAGNTGGRETWILL
jgi:hypothetical protein